MDMQNGIIRRIPIKPPIRPRVLCPVTPVTRSSPAAFKTALEHYARFFRREFGYDFVPYTKYEHSQDANLRAFLFPHDSKEFWSGGCSFWKDQGAWILTWVWMHPFDRNQGILRAAWPHFEREYGPFRIDSPVSIPMQFFLLRQGVAEARCRGGYLVALTEKGKSYRGLRSLFAPRLATGEQPTAEVRALSDSNAM